MFHFFLLNRCLVLEAFSDLEPLVLCPVDFLARSNPGVFNPIVVLQRTSVWGDCCSVDEPSTKPA